MGVGDGPRGAFGAGKGAPFADGCVGNRVGAARGKGGSEGREGIVISALVKARR